MSLGYLWGKGFLNEGVYIILAQGIVKVFVHLVLALNLDGPFSC